jgi:hypothetical protein
MSTARKTQRGMGMLGMIVVVGLIAFFATLLVKLGPAYASYWTVKSIMDDVAATPGVAAGGKHEIVSRISKQMDVNDVSAVGPGALAVEKVGTNEFDVKVAYERREHLFFNVDAVLTFAHEVTVRDQ